MVRLGLELSSEIDLISTEKSCLLSFKVRI